MFDKIQMMLRRLKPAKTLGEALEQLVPPRLVKLASEEVSRRDLIEFIAKELVIDADQLLGAAAARLGLGFETSLHAPTVELISATAYPSETLRDLGVVVKPWNGPGPGYALVISDPDVVSLDEYHELGVPVCLALGSTVQRAWETFDINSLTPVDDIAEAQILPVVKQVAWDAHQLGAQAVFIGYPSDESYEFLACDKKYAGELHPALYPKLVEMLSSKGSISEASETDGVRSITLSLTRSFLRPIICLTWEAVQEKALLSAADDTEQQLAGDSSSNRNQNQGPTEQADEGSQEVVSAEILVVDDDERFCFILSRILESKGWKTETRPDGEAALEALRTNSVKPDIIVSDIHMPNMDGACFVEELRKLDQTIPILMLTSDEDCLLEAEAALLGIDAFIRKQEDPRVLLAWVNNLLNKQQKLQNRTSEVAQDSPAVAVNSENVIELSSKRGLGR